MSWSVSFLGTQTAIIKALDAESARLKDASKTEFDAALPHLKALVEENVGEGRMFSLTANGHASFTLRDNALVKTYANCQMTLQPLSGTLVRE